MSKRKCIVPQCNNPATCLVEACGHHGSIFLCGGYESLQEKLQVAKDALKHAEAVLSFCVSEMDQNTVVPKASIETINEVLNQLE